MRDYDEPPIVWQKVSIYLISFDLFLLTPSFYLPLHSELSISLVIRTSDMMSSKNNCYKKLGTN